MKFNFKKHILDLESKGITYIEDFYSQKDCKKYINIFEKLIKKNVILKNFVNSGCQLIPNSFRHNTILSKLIYNYKLDKIFKKIIDKNYVLIDSTVINRKIDKNYKKIYKKKLGDDWHTDSRYNNNKRLDKGFSYLTISMFNDFTNDNSATRYVPSSLKRRDRPIRKKKYNSKPIIGKAGTLVIMDTGIWHKAGKPSENNRWSIFNYYGPWYMKPYFDFPKMMKNHKLSKTLKKLLHFNSLPPVNESIRTNTITKL